jgi:Fe-S cluster assembly scaffold protein SufB
MFTSNISEAKERKVLMTAQSKHGVLIIGDSHVQGYAERLSDNLGHSFNVTGYVKPNADLNIITTTAKSESINMTKDDVAV